MENATLNIIWSTVRGVNESAEVFAQATPPSFQDGIPRSGDHQTLACLANVQGRSATTGRSTFCGGEGDKSTPWDHSCQDDVKTRHTPRLGAANSH
jgi:hypothetical protein